jgi:hypothetical protein
MPAFAFLLLVLAILAALEPCNLFLLLSMLTFLMPAPTLRTMLILPLTFGLTFCFAALPLPRLFLSMGSASGLNLSSLLGLAGALPLAPFHPTGHGPAH